MPGNNLIFSHVMTALNVQLPRYLTSAIGSEVNFKTYELRCKKTSLQGVQPGLTQNSLYGHR